MSTDARMRQDARIQELVEEAKIAKHDAEIAEKNEKGILTEYDKGYFTAYWHAMQTACKIFGVNVSEL